MVVSNADCFLQEYVSSLPSFFEGCIRSNRKLYCKGKPINEKLLEHGLSVIDARFCRISEYAGEAWAQNYGCN